jgi:hypothetical protein
MPRVWWLDSAIARLRCKGRGICLLSKKEISENTQYSSKCP